VAAYLGQLIADVLAYGAISRLILYFIAGTTRNPFRILIAHIILGSAFTYIAVLGGTIIVIPTISVIAWTAFDLIRSGSKTTPTSPP